MNTEPIEIQLHRAPGVRRERATTDPRALDAAFAVWDDSGRRLDRPSPATQSALDPTALAEVVGQQLVQLNQQRQRLETLLKQIGREQD